MNGREIDSCYSDVSICSFVRQRDVRVEDYEHLKAFSFGETSSYVFNSFSEV